MWTILALSLAGLKSYPARQFLALSSLQNAGYFGEFGAFDRPRHTKKAYRVAHNGGRAVHVLERACVAGVMTCCCMAFRRKYKRSRSAEECHNDSIPRQPPQHGVEHEDVRDTTRDHLCGVAERCGAEIGAI